MEVSGTNELVPSSPVILTGGPEKPVGNTGVARMQNEVDGRSTRSAENLILTVSKRSCLDTGASASIVQLVESLIWPFVCRRSTRKGDWFSTKELDRFVVSMRKVALTLVKYSSEDNREQTFLKYWLDTLVCQVFRDPQRPSREPWIHDPLFVGWCKRFVLRAIARRDVSFIYSLQKGSKRAWPSLGEVKLKAAYDKHKINISTDRGEVPLPLKEEIYHCSRQVFKSLGDRYVAKTKFMPTGSACLQASRRKGGALSLIDRFQFPFKKLVRTQNWVLPVTEASVIGKLPVLNAELNQWRQDQFSAVEARVINSIQDPQLRESLLDVKVVAIPEPGKFRIITEGDGYLYTALQPLQGLMLSSWKKHYASTMLSNDLSEKVRNIDKNVDLPFWCSVDYESATDLLKKDASFASFQALVDMQVPQFELGYFSLLAGRALYPDGTVVDTIEGQLMGHPLSFPLLCVINLAVYQRSLTIWAERDNARKRILPTLRKNVLVNGDDMLFKCDQEFYDIFLGVAASAGFKISQGKNYLSPDCCMINSQVFRRVGGIMRRHGYLNLKLITGTSLKGGDSEATPTQLGKDLSAMVRLCPWTNCSIPAAFKRWSRDWFGVFYRPNWYLPVHLGGFGLDPTFAPSGWKITRDQRLMAARFVNDPRMALYRLKGLSLPTAELAGALANWRMVVGSYVPGEHESEDISDEWLSRLAYASRAHTGSVLVSDKVFVSKFKPEYRLKPMSIESLGLYWNARVLASRLPPCPPVGSLFVRNAFPLMGTSVWSTYQFQ